MKYNVIERIKKYIDEHVNQRDRFELLFDDNPKQVSHLIRTDTAR